MQKIGFAASKSRLFRQSVFGRLGGYEDVNDADRLGGDPAIRWVVGGQAVAKLAASASPMKRFESGSPATEGNMAALADLSGHWTDRVHDYHPPKKVAFDMDSRVGFIDTNLCRPAGQVVAFYNQRGRAENCESRKEERSQIDTAVHAQGFAIDFDGTETCR